MKRRTVLGMLIAIILLALIIPVSKQRVLLYGTDSYTAHRLLFGTHTATQNITTSAFTTKIGTILVDLRKTNAITDVELSIYAQNSDNQLAHAFISRQSIQDDAFAFADISNTPIPKNTLIRLEFSAPEATSTNPIGLRVDTNTGEFSLALAERVPLWKAIGIIASNRANDWAYSMLAIGLSIIVALPAFVGSKPWQWKTALGAICIFALAARLAVIPHFGGVSGGDAYNYLSITQSIIHGGNPFVNTKRLPGYPLLLVPTLASGIFDDQYVMRTLQAFAGVWGAIMVAMLARSMKLSWPVAIAAPAILLFQKDYFWTSMRPEPYALYGALLVTALWTFIRGYQTSVRWRHILFGVVLGYTAMTRQEGFVLAAVLGTCSLCYEVFTVYKTKNVRTSLVRFAYMYAPALLIVLPFFSYNIVTYGKPFYAEYLEGDRLQIVDSFLALQDATSATWGVIGSMWKPAWEQLERLPLTSPVAIVSTIVLGIWYWYLKKARYIPVYVSVGAGVVFFITIWMAMYMRSIYIVNITAILAAWTLVSIPIFLYETRWKGAVLIAVLASQIGIATWFHPFAKHYQQSFPLIILMLTAALIAALPHKKAITGIALAVIVLPFFSIASLLTQKINAAIDDQNEDTALDSVAYRAARFARTLPGPIGFDQAYLPARLYFDPDAKYFPDEDYPTAEMEQAWLAKNPIRTLIDTNGNHVFKNPDPLWKLLRTFKAAGKNEKIFVASVYEIPQ